MSKSQNKSTEVISQRQLRKMTMILADRWTETYEIVETRNSQRSDFQQRYDFWLNQISL